MINKKNEIFLVAGVDEFIGTYLVKDWQRRVLKKNINKLLNIGDISNEKKIY